VDLGGGLLLGGAASAMQSWRSWTCRPMWAELVRARLEVGAPVAGDPLGCGSGRMLGSGGHFSTKGRRYATTLGALRQAQAAFAARRHRPKSMTAVGRTSIQEAPRRYVREIAPTPAAATLEQVARIVSTPRVPWIR
jgi:hypothetical protein